jgi:hypothetical protein
LRQDLSQKPAENLFESRYFFSFSMEHVKVGLQREPKARVESIYDHHEGFREENTGQTQLIFASSKISA